MIIDNVKCLNYLRDEFIAYCPQYDCDKYSLSFFTSAKLKQFLLLENKNIPLEAINSYIEDLYNSQIQKLVSIEISKEIVPICKEFKEDIDSNICIWFLCFPLSFEYIRRYGNNNITLVHGQFEEGNYHAWLEINDTFIFDPVLQRFYILEPYYRLKKIARVMKYSYIEALNKLNTETHAGIWEDFNILATNLQS
ncbi:hypothetical protein [Clostridium tagluense]|uniref:Uncharacterized protein n=1 Tax=Clostridium tagluense TaxID=360422 RepID=A0A401UPF1_9CLOT|nr:hypothetical protein [Clostridium tagluense]GCD11397.1 hypothetical protein Ctaglu_30200 [Clostridium tagluense]